MRLPESVRCHKGDGSRRIRRPARIRGSCADVPADVRRDDPANTRTTQPKESYHPPADHRARRSTSVRSWSFHSQVPEPEPGYRRRATWPWPAHGERWLRPADLRADSFHLPSRPASNAPVPLLRARTSLTDDTKADGHSILRAARARVGQGLPTHARSGDSVLA